MTTLYLVCKEERKNSRKKNCGFGIRENMSQAFKYALQGGWKSRLQKQKVIEAHWFWIALLFQACALVLKKSSISYVGWHERMYTMGLKKLSYFHLAVFSWNFLEGLVNMQILLIWKF